MTTLDGFGKVVDESTAIQLCQMFDIYQNGMDGADCIIALDTITSFCSHCQMPTYTVNSGCVDCKFPKYSTQQEEVCNSCGVASLFYGDGTCGNCGV